jgi:lipopolysaccharide biosynthesis glycosyltransferase
VFAPSVPLRARDTPVRDPLVLVSGCDDRFALSLGVMLYSVVANLAAGDALHVYVLDGGISAANKQRITRVLATPHVTVSLEWLSPDLELIQRLPQHGQHNAFAYMRLLIAELLPAGLERAIYLDCDLVVEENLRALWETDMGSALALGVEDFYAPVAASPAALGATYRQLGLAPDTLCCNSGVMVLNLPRWRHEQVGPRVLDYTQRYARHLQAADQDGINAVLAGDWGLLDPRWNVQLRTVAWYGSERIKDAAELRRIQEPLLRNPFVTHYVGPVKPWSYTYRKTHSERFLHYLRRSGWFDAPVALAWSYSRQLSHSVLYTLARLKAAVAGRSAGRFGGVVHMR